MKTRVATFTKDGGKGLTDFLPPSFVNVVTWFGELRNDLTAAILTVNRSGKRSGFQNVGYPDLPPPMW